jgi:3,4-dihydroxy-2-butanone 4-phosphate synthase
MTKGPLSTVEEIIDEARNGRIFILVDDEDRENEGDLIIPAQMATPDAINFMATHGRGLICLALDRPRVEQLGLAPMAQDNSSPHGTAFTSSIEAREGVTTGISAADRARTILVAIDAAKGAADLVSPGHVFPLVARDGGVLVRAGHTEAAVDIARLAGLNPSGVICEIMNEDGTMARMDDLVAFAQRHGLKVGTIRDLIAYRRRFDNMIRRVAEERFISEFGGEWLATVYANTTDGKEHLVLQKGLIEPDRPTLVRMQVMSPFTDMLGEQNERTGLLHRVMETIAEGGSGVLVLLRDSSSDWLAQLFRRRRESGSGTPLRDYGIGAQILCDLGVHDMVLLTTTHREIVGLDGYGLRVVEERFITRNGQGQG